KVDELDRRGMLVGPAHRLEFGAVSRHWIDERSDRERIGIRQQCDGRLGSLARHLRNKLAGVGQAFNEHEVGFELIEITAQVPGSRGREVPHAKDIDSPGSGHCKSELNAKDKAFSPSPLYSGERVGVRGYFLHCAAHGEGPAPSPSPPSTGERQRPTA